MESGVLFARFHEEAIEEARLAAPGRALQHDESRRALPRLGECGVQDLEGRPAPNEGRVATDDGSEALGSCCTRMPCSAPPGGRAALAERLLDRLRGLGALVGFLLQQVPDQYGHAGIEGVAETLERGRVLLQDATHDRAHRGVGEGMHPGQQLVQQTTQGEEVAAWVCFLVTSELLGRRVEDGADELARLADPRGLGRPARDTEVDDLDPPVGREEDVLRLEVAVHDACLVDSSEPRRDLGTEMRGQGFGDRAVRFEDVMERGAGHQLHDEGALERTTRAADLDGVVDAHHVRMLQARADPGFAHEALREILREGGMQDLHGDLVGKPRRRALAWARTMHLAHAARSEAFEKIEGTKHLGLHRAEGVCQNDEPPRGPSRQT